MTEGKSNAGLPFYGELISADASTAAALVLFDANGTTISAIGANQRLRVEDEYVQTASALTIDLFFDRNGDGVVDAKERLTSGFFAANGGVLKRAGVPFFGPLGSVALKAKASGAGNIRVHVRGTIVG